MVDRSHIDRRDVDRVGAALRAFGELRGANAYRSLPSTHRSALDAQIGRIERTLRGEPTRPPLADAYSELLGTPDDLQRDLEQRRAGRAPAPGNTMPANGPADKSGSAPPSGQVPTPATAQIGQRTSDSIDAIDFPGFVASLVTGTFQAVIDASKQQISAYAELVASLSQTVENFSSDKVTPNQTRDWLREKHPQDLQILLPRPGREDRESPRLVPRPERDGESPAWLELYGLGGQALTAELADGALVDAGRLKVGEERMQTLATLVLMGINRVVVGDGNIRARLQFHASARDTIRAEVGQQQVGIAGQAIQAAQATNMMVSTLKVNAQSDASIKADLMGEVQLNFRSETFPLDRFADSAAIQLINRHARWQKPAAPASPISPERPEGDPTARPLPASPPDAASDGSGA